MLESRNLGNSFSSGTVVDDLTFVIRDLQYSSVLDVPFYKQILHQLYSFFGKINVSVSTPTFLGYIYYIIFIMQSFLPAFLIDCDDLWPKDSLMTMIMYVIGYVFQGPHNSIKSARVPMSLVVAIIFLVLILVLIFRAKIFQKIGRVASAETKFILFTYKYIMPLFCPHLMVGVAISFDKIINDKKIGLNIAQIILSIIIFALYIFLLCTVICPRVLLEDTPSHEWFPYITVAGTVNTTLISLISNIAGCVEGKNRTGCSIFMLIESAVFGFTVFYTNSVIKMIIGVVSSATCIASAVTSLLVTIDLFLSKPISPEILFVVSVIVYIILIICLRLIKQNKITKLMLFLDDLMVSGETSRDILEQKYTSPSKILIDLPSAIELWHPYLLSFEIFDFAISKWSDNFNILILYARILSFFPNKNLQLMVVASMISKLPEKSSRNSYLYQFRHLSRTRQTSMTKVVLEKLEQINSKKEIIMVLMRQFWENILQKNIVNFWTDSDRVHDHISELDSILAQLVDDYPNNYKVLQAYLDFVQNIKRDHLEARDITKKIESLKKNVQIKSDLALELALLVFPNLHNYLQVVEQPTQEIPSYLDENDNLDNSFPPKESENNENEHKEEENQLEEDHKEEESKKTESNENTDQNQNKNSEVEEEDDEESRNKNITTEQDEDIQVQCALSELIKRSKLGCIWFECIFVVLMTILSIVLFYLFYDYYIDNFVDRQKKAIDFLEEIDMLVYELNFFTVNNVILPLTFIDSGEIIPGLSIENRDEYTRNLATKLWDAGRIPPFSLSTNVSVNLLTAVKERFSQMIVSLSLLDNDDPYVQQINYLFSGELVGGLYSIKDIATQELLIAQDILKYNEPSHYFKDNNLFTRLKNYYLLIYQQFSKMADLSRLYASSSFDSGMDKLNEKMILVILMTILLITLPYLLQLFLLKIQSDSIAESFTYFPNTEIRSIINKYGKSSSKNMDEDLTQVAALSHFGRNNHLSTTLVVLTFLSSFLVLIICSLVIYFTARGFIDNAASISNGIYTLSPAFASLTIAFSQCLRFYMITHWKNPPICFLNTSLDANPFATIGENMTDLLQQGIGMLFLSLSSFSSGMWSQDGGVNAFFKDQGKSFDVFEDVFPRDTTIVGHDKSIFEKMATASFVESVDLAIGHLSSVLFYQYSSAPEHITACLTGQTDKFAETFKPFTEVYDGMPALIYWFSNFSEINRTRIYFDLVEKNVLNQIGSYKSTGQICFIIVIVWQILACFFMILYMIDRNWKIKQSLRFYHFIKPEIILQNQNVLKLIDSGRQISQSDDIVNSNSDYIVSQIDQGVVVTEKNLTITNYNPSFAQRVQMIDDNLNGIPLTDLILKSNNDKTWENFIQHVNDALSGRYKCQFSENISVQLKSGQLAHFNCTATCLTPNGIPNEGEHSAIDKVAFLFDDNVEIFMREQMINQEKKHLTDMLANVMPSRIVHNFEASGEGMSFVVQSVSIGSIRVQALKKFNPETSEEFTFYNEIFSRFDEEIKEFDLLMKVHTFVHTYTYIGGLFSEVNKPERHAEESIKFALKLIKLIPEFSEKYGAEIHLTFGVHTGGPVVAGVMSLSKPTFQIIGPISEMANQLKSKGVLDQICISRAVYELIFSAGFNVQERGDMTIRGGKVIPTYLVRI
ncbi:hypothetical protein M9Y10_008212 [Tritrichomonas musculus]|uniref:Guanylate cyclase domain-containing protein n=1 Tax=Tritrichomonas musculus TaxID=1915356 RepID=A0ABR2IYB2_9EUKA